MQLMTLKAFKARYFTPSSAPSDVTIKRWIEEGEIAGRKLGGKYFIDAHKFELTGNKLVDQVLSA